MSAPAPPRFDIAAGAAALDVLARAGGSGCPFQSAGWLGAWVAGHGGLDTLRVATVVQAEGQWLLPVMLVRQLGCTLARKIGGSHASFYTPLRVGAPVPLDLASLRAATRALGADALILTDCPTDWDAHAVLAPGFAQAPDIGRGAPLVPGQPPVLAGPAAKKQRAKQRALESLGALGSGFSQGPAAQEALAVMLRWKEEQLGSRGIIDPFEGPAMRGFLEAGLESGALRMFVLTLAARPVAAMLVAQAGGFSSGMTTAYDPAPEIARASPGDVLLSRLVEALALEGSRWFDLGVGDMRYKRAHCPEVLPLVDVIVPASLPGRAFCAVYAAGRATKRAIKSNARLLALLENSRATLRGK